MGSHLNHIIKNGGEQALRANGALEPNTSETGRSIISVFLLPNGFLGIHIEEPHCLEITNMEECFCDDR
jgi:hypothetical protein